ncbi:MAG: alkaline phosphatase [Prevotella sp.]|nr:alkaline phosphatase [Prevotella sp.]
MKKRLNLTVILLMIATMCCMAGGKKAKYVFYFITDGTGVNTVLAAEMYRAELEGRIGRVPCSMSLFPVVGISSTFSTSSGVTDSAASGTALATGVKTNNGAIGMAPDMKTPVTSIAVWAKEAGMRVGVASSCPVNHATPAAFIAHRASRKDYYGIGLDMVKAGFDFYAGSEVNKHTDKKNYPGQPDIYDIMRKAGYTVAFGIDEYEKMSRRAERILLVQDTTRLNPASGTYSIPYAIDAKEGEMRIEDILRAEIDFLMKDNKRGFFLMNEIGGKVDWACHALDGAATFAEVEAVDRCVKIALEFYEKHPDETLIVLTADHETGGLVLAPDDIYEVKLRVLKNQKLSTDGFTAILHNMRKETRNRVTWEQAKAALTENFGFWTSLEMTTDEEEELKQVWHESFEDKAEEIKNEYTANEPLAVLARNIINKKAMITWNTRGHSAGLVPVYAIGVGQELFSSHNDNADIPLKIARAAGYKTPFDK